MMDKIPYYVRYEETSTISNTDWLYYDNDTNTAQSITWADFKTQLEDDDIIIPDTNKPDVDSNMDTQN